MDLGVAGRVALIVGGARGIGFAIGQELAAGHAKVVVADIDEVAAREVAARLLLQGASQALGLGIDVSNLPSVQAAFSEIGRVIGTPQIVVVTAAIVADKLFMDSSPADWRPMIDICLIGPMNVLHAALPGMTNSGYGRVVCMATDSARVGQARLSYYAAAKAGVIALIKSLAQEVGPNGVTLNVVSPGATNTELRRKREEATRAEIGEEKYNQRVQKVLRMYPTRRLGEPEDVAALTAFLVSDRASWITGQVISVNGGFVMP